MKRGIIVININQINDKNKFKNDSILLDKGDYSDSRRTINRSRDTFLETKV